jgi:hypothetical protein
MKLNLARRRVAIVLGAMATTAAVFAPSAVAVPPRGPFLECEQLGGHGLVTLSEQGVAKGRCTFPDGFPQLGFDDPQEVGHAVHVSCADLAEALQIPLSAVPTGQATLTPSGIANVNCHNVVLGGTG